MNRRTFLKMLAVGTAAVVAFPQKLFALNQKPKLAEGHLTMFAGKAGTGKSAWLLYSAMQFAEQGKTILYQDFDAGLTKEFYQRIKQENNFTFSDSKFVVSTASEILWDRLSSFDVVVFDSLTAHFAVDKRESHILVIRRLHALAMKRKQVFLFSQQVHRSPVTDKLAVPIGNSYVSSTIYMAKPDMVLDTVKSRSGKFLSYKMDKNFRVM